MSYLLSGRWIVLEDIDLAPPEILSAITSLLGSGVLRIPGRQEVGALLRVAFPWVSISCTLPFLLLSKHEFMLNMSANWSGRFDLHCNSGD